MLRDDTYCCGIWLNDPLGLAWTVDHPEDPELDQQLSPSQRNNPPPPSWSWASQNQPIIYPMYPMHPMYHLTHILCRMTGFRVEQSQITASIQGRLLLIGPHNSEAHDYPYGDNPTRVLILRESLGSVKGRTTQASSQRTHNWFLQEDGRNRKLRTKGDHATESVYFLPVCQNEKKKSNKPRSRLGGILLRPVSNRGPGAFERVGWCWIISENGNVSTLLAHFQRHLTADDYQEIDEDGVCTITLF